MAHPLLPPKVHTQGPHHPHPRSTPKVPTPKVSSIQTQGLHHPHPRSTPTVHTQGPHTPHPRCPHPGSRIHPSHAHASHPRCTRTHTRTRTHARAHTHTRTRTRMHTQTPLPRYTTCTLERSHEHACTHTHTHMPARTHAKPGTQAHTHPKIAGAHAQRHQHAFSPQQRHSPQQRRSPQQRHSHNKCAQPTTKAHSPQQRHSPTHAPCASVAALCLAGHPGRPAQRPPWTYLGTAPGTCRLRAAQAVGACSGRWCLASLGTGGLAHAGYKPCRQWVHAVLGDTWCTRCNEAPCVPVHRGPGTCRLQAAQAVGACSVRRYLVYAM